MENRMTLTDPMMVPRTKLMRNLDNNPTVQTELTFYLSEILFKLLYLDLS